MRSTTCTEVPRAAFAALLALLPLAASANGGSSAEDAAQAVGSSLPRELASGIMALEAVAEDGEVAIMLNVAADLPTPDSGGFARLACIEAELAAFVEGGGTVRFDLRGRTLATVDRCSEAP